MAAQQLFGVKRILGAREDDAGRFAVRIHWKGRKQEKTWEELKHASRSKWALRQFAQRLLKAVDELSDDSETEEDQGPPQKNAGDEPKQKKPKQAANQGKKK